MTMLIAYTREVSPALASCELTHLEREPLDVAGAQAEHEVYESVLERGTAAARRCLRRRRGRGARRSGRHFPAGRTFKAA